jgi:putative Holliday junction resolvase
MAPQAAGSILALDVGDRRIGLALAHPVARLASPLITLDNSSDVWERLLQVIQQQDVTQLVVGLPRNLQGDDTAQTKRVRQFVEELQAHIQLPVVLQDEALTSRKAEQELAARGKAHTKSDIDALAATYILEDYLRILL